MRLRLRTIRDGTRDHNSMLPWAPYTQLELVLQNRLLSCEIIWVRSNYARSHVYLSIAGFDWLFSSARAGT